MTNLFLAAGAALLISAAFLPVVCVFFVSGMYVVGGCASLWGISPVLGSLIVVCVASAAGSAMWRQHDELSGALLTAGLFLALTGATGAAVLWFEVLIIHPYFLVAIVAAAGAFVVAAFLAKRPGQSIRCRFHLRTLLLCVTMAGLFMGALVMAFD
jgi:hypothetical protein